MKAKYRTSRPLSPDDAALEADSRWLIACRAAGSSALSRATQLRDILLFIVRQTILHPEEPIRESEIAHRALGRRSDFNPLDDNIVRVQMAHLRKKLELFYGSEGKDEETVITVALGSYRPIFAARARVQQTSHATPEPSGAIEREGAPASVPESASTVLARDASSAVLQHRPEGRLLRFSPAVLSLAAVATLLFCVAVGLGIKVRNQQRSLVEMQDALTPWRAQPAVAALWSAFFDSPHDTDFLLGDDSLLLVEQLSSQSTSFNGYLSRSYLSESQTEKLDPGRRFALNLVASKGLGSTSEFKLAQRLMALDSRSKKVHLYGARQYIPSLLKQDNAVLIGGRISNPYESIFEDRLNFVETMKFEGLGNTSVLNRVPKPGEQKEYLSADSVGYCVVAYLPNPAQGSAVLLLEGTGSEATEAAGDFLTSQEQLSGLLGKLHASSFPPFEVLLKISLVRGTPLAATIEAYRAYPSTH